MLHPLPQAAAPHLVTPLPGPRARQVIDRDRRVTSPSYTRVYPLVAARGTGAVLEDVDGNRFLDFTAGIAVCSTGHCHPRVVRAIQQQAERLLHMSGTDFYYEPQQRLAERLAELAPGREPKRVFFTNSGAESVEAAFKLARYHTGRRYVIAFLSAFHGRTLGALSLTSSKPVQRRGFGPLVPDVVHVAFPYCYRCPRQRGYRQGHCAAGDCCLGGLEQLDQLLHTKLSADEVAAVVVEPIQGEGGYVVPPPDFHPRLRAWTRHHGILYVADEVQTGMGRTGRMFCSEHWGVEPDIVCLAKGIASGMPLGAMIASEDIMDWPPGAHASTFGGNPVACVAALETLALLEEGLLDQAREVGDYLQASLRQLAERHAWIGDVRGLGLMVGAELVRDRTSREPAPELVERLIDGAFRRGLLLLSCGRSTLRFCPPLVITTAQVDTAMEILDDVLCQLTADHAPPDA